MATHDDIALDEEFAQSSLRGSLLKRLFAYTHPYRRALYTNLALTLLATASALVGPRLIQHSIDHALSPVLAAGGASTALSESAAAHEILILSGLYLANLLLGWGLTVIQVRTSIETGQGAMNAYKYLHIHAYLRLKRPPVASAASSPIKARSSAK